MRILPIQVYVARRIAGAAIACMIPPMDMRGQRNSPLARHSLGLMAGSGKQGWLLGRFE
jgi:hypothetical protein